MEVEKGEEKVFRKVVERTLWEVLEKKCENV